MPVVPDRWALLRVRFEGPFVVVRLTDSEGGRTKTHWEGPFVWPPLALAVVADRLTTLLTDLPLARPGPHNTGPVPLAVFVDVPDFLWLDLPRLDGFLQPLALLDIHRLQVVGFTGSLRRRRPTFSLPFDVVAYGALAQAAVQEIRGQYWAQDLAVQQRGFSVLDVDGAEHSALERALRTRDRDVLVTDSAAEAMAVCRSLPLHRRPRLIVSLDPLTPVLPPGGTALAYVGPVTHAVKEILFALVHDLPLHEALKAATRTIPFMASWARVFADPWTNQSLRIRDALITLQSEAERLETCLPQVGIAPFLERVYSRSTGEGRVRIAALQERLRTTSGAADLLEQAENALTELRAVRAGAAPVRSLPSYLENFEQEGEGLVPMAHNSTIIQELAGRAERVSMFTGLALDADFSAVLQEHQERVVDLGLQRLDTSPLLSSLGRHTTLQAGAVYRLRVHIGNPLPDSLVVGPQPPIDPLLPEPEAAGHMLDVVVQGKDFEVVGEHTQPLHLPRFGGSRPVYFGVRAPRQAGEASLRAHVYYRNHLVHSYLLEAEITTAEQESPEDLLRVVLTYAPVERLADLDTTGARTLSIGANQGPNGTHQIVVKGTDGAGEITLFPSTFEPEVDKFLKELENASRNPRNPSRGRVYPKALPGAPAPPDAAAVLRRFAQQGWDLYASVKKRAITSSGKLAKAFQFLRTNPGQKIQIVRLDPNFVFPWMLLYDFMLPETTAPDPPVCLGSITDAAGAVHPCGHSFDSKVYCVNGFWCVRHFMEELIKREHEMTGPVARPPKDAVRLVGDSGLAGYSDLQTELTTKIGAPQLTIGPAAETSLLDLLWADPPERPSILIVLGHMDTQTIVGFPDSPGIVLDPPGEWLTQKHFDESLNGSWDQPRPIVMLMACDAATTTVKTVNNFVTSFHSAGAAAIVGAEAVVASDLAAECAREITKALWSSTTLGEAMTAFRRSTLAAGNPLAFVFRAIGSVDLTIQ